MYDKMLTIAGDMLFVAYVMWHGHYRRSTQCCVLLQQKPHLTRVHAACPLLHALLLPMQDAEREKLHVTVSLQALRTALALREERKQQLKEFSDQHARPTGKAVDHVHSHTCGCGHGDEDDDDDGLGNSSKTASDEDIEAAIKEALQRLDGCVQTINDALEDVRYAVEDLREEQESCMMES